MGFFDVNPMEMPFDAQYYFDVCVINIAVRESLNGEFEDIWDLSGVLEPRPYVIHFFQDEDDAFDEDRDWDVEIYHHCVLEVSDSLGVSFFTTDSSDIDVEEEFGDYADPDDFWRF